MIACSDCPIGRAANLTTSTGHEAERRQTMEQTRKNLGEHPEPAELPNEIAAIQTPDQRGIAKVFHILS